jgi:Ricin-type beta-trefoil lectin domain
MKLRTNVNAGGLSLLAVAALTRFNRLLSGSRRVILAMTLIISVASASDPDDSTLRTGKQIASAGQTVLDYYSNAKTGLEIGTLVFKLLGIIDTQHDDQNFQALMSTINAGFTDNSWQEREGYLGMRRGSAMWALSTTQKKVDLCARHKDPKDNALVAITKCQAGGEAIYPVMGENEDESSGTAVTDIINSSGTHAVFYSPMSARQSIGMNYLGYTKSDLYPQSNNMTYDWRLGIPALLQVIAYRLNVIAAIDPNFRYDGLFTKDLKLYRDILIEHYNKMLKGVKCAAEFPASFSKIRCADIYTGYSTIAWRGGSSDYVGVEFDSLFWSNTLSRGTIANPSVTEVITQLKAMLTSRMPLFELKAMIDTLYEYSNPPQADLTEVSHRISPVSSPGLCLDVTDLHYQPFYGRGAKLEVCDGSVYTQRWTYDRQTGTIKNPATGTTTEQCLGLTGWSLSSHVVSQGWYVGTADCDGGAAQQWTYDPESRVLLNAWSGAVLDVQWNNLIAGTLVWAWPLNYSEAQLWQADQHDPHQICSLCLP